MRSLMLFFMTTVLSAGLAQSLNNPADSALLQLFPAASSSPEEKVHGVSYAVSCDEYHSLAFAGLNNRVVIYDISRPGKPRKLSESIEVPGLIHDLDCSSYILCIACGAGGFEICDVRDPTLPRKLSSLSIPGYAYAVDLANIQAYLAAGDSGLMIIDISDPAGPVMTGRYRTPGPALSVRVKGYQAYIADYDAGLRIVNVADPGSPREVGFYDTPGYALDVDIAGYYVYVADYKGLCIVDVRDIFKPVMTGYYRTIGIARGVCVRTPYAYIADHTAGLRIININRPTNLEEAGFHYTPGQACAVSLVDVYAYIAGDSGLFVQNISRSSNQKLLLLLPVILFLFWVPVLLH
jgi:hypothetical protein